MDDSDTASLKAQIAALTVAVQALSAARAPRPSLTLNAIAARYAKRTARRSMYSLAFLLKALGGRDVATLRKADYLAFRDERAKTCGVGTLNQELLQALAMLRWAVANELIEANPLEGIKKLKGQRARETVIDPLEHQRAFADAPLLVRVFQAACIETGARNGCEVRRMERSHVDGARSEITIPRANAKGKTRTRRVPMSNYLKALLEEMLPVVGSPYIFANAATKEPYSYAYLNRLSRPYLDRLRAATGDGRVVTHDARHSLITHLISDGLDPFASMKVVGHETVSQHWRYHHLSEADRTKAKRLIDGRRGPKATAQIEARRKREITR